jgi:hypothetical protein
MQQNDVSVGCDLKWKDLLEQATARLESSVENWEAMMCFQVYILSSSCALIDVPKRQTIELTHLHRLQPFPQKSKHDID